jgi:hypothetical protein
VPFHPSTIVSLSARVKFNVNIWKGRIFVKKEKKMYRVESPEIVGRKKEPFLTHFSLLFYSMETFLTPFNKHRVEAPYYFRSNNPGL